MGTDGFYLEADVIVRATTTTTRSPARAPSRARYNGKILRTDEFVYDQTSGVVTGPRRDVQILNPDGSSEFAKEMILDKDFNAAWPWPSPAGRSPM